MSNEDQAPKKRPWTQPHVMCSVRMPEPLNRKLEKASKKSKASKSQLIIHAVAAFLGNKD